MTDLIHVAILILAVFRITRMLHSESLPFNIGAKFRYWLPDGFLSRHWLTSWIVDLFLCPYCLMLWVTIGVYFLNKSELGYTVIVILAMSGGAMFVWDIWEIIHYWGIEDANSETETD